MKPTKEMLNENEFLDDQLQDEELDTIIGGIEYEDINLKCFEETINKSQDLPKISN